eukprot:313729-Pleurochrysis_carterae.AAC.2
MWIASNVKAWVNKSKNAAQTCFGKTCINGLRDRLSKLACSFDIDSHTFGARRGLSVRRALRD